MFTFVDTPGAYPGIDAEERGQSEAIGRNIFEMAQLEVPIIVPSSAKAAPAARCDLGGRPTGHLQYSIYSVISPEGAHRSLEDQREAQEAADALGITAPGSGPGPGHKIGNEPVGGAHRDHKQMAAFLKRALNDASARSATSRSRNCSNAATSACRATAATRHHGREHALTRRGPMPAAFREDNPPLTRSHRGGAVPLAVAYSGGADSTALLHAAASLWPARCMPCMCTTACKRLPMTSSAIA